MDTRLRLAVLCGTALAAAGGAAWAWARLRRRAALPAACPAAALGAGDQVPEPGGAAGEAAGSASGSEAALGLWRAAPPPATSERAGPPAGPEAGADSRGRGRSSRSPPQLRAVGPRLAGVPGFLPPGLPSRHLLPLHREMAFAVPPRPSYPFFPPPLRNFAHVPG